MSLRFHDVLCYPQSSDHRRRRRIFGKSFIRFVFCVCSVAGSARAALPLSEVLDRMEAQQRSIQDVTFRFEERVQRGDFPAETLSGKVQFRQPHALRIDQKEPNTQRLIADGATFWLYSPAQKQELTGDWPSWVKQSHFPLPLLEWAGTLSPEHWKSRYTVLFGGYHAPEYELHFKPRQVGDGPLTMWISEQTFLPVRGAMQLDGVSVQVTLRDTRLNSGLGAAVFTPRIPAGTERVPIHF